MRNVENLNKVLIIFIVERVECGNGESWVNICGRVGMEGVGLTSVVEWGWRE